VAVAALAEVAIGGTCALAVGGRGSRLDQGPVTLEVSLESRSGGGFDLEDRQSHLASMVGSRFEMGPCAVVRSGGVTILLTSRKTPPFDLGQLRSQGLEPRSFAVIGVKAAVAHKRAYDPIAGVASTVDTAGPCSSKPGSFAWRRTAAACLAARFRHRIFLHLLYERRRFLIRDPSTPVSHLPFSFGRPKSVT